MALGSLLSKAIGGLDTSAAKALKGRNWSSVAPRMRLPSPPLVGKAAWIHSSAGSKPWKMNRGGRSLPSIGSVRPSTAYSPVPGTGPISRMSGSQVMGSIALAAGIGGGIGGYYQQGGIGGALSGAAGGMALGALAGGGLPHAVKWGAGMASGTKMASQYSGHIAKVGEAINTTAGRRNLFAAGGMLGGIAFGGPRNSRRGFNKNRGSYIGR